LVHNNIRKAHVAPRCHAKSKHTGVTCKGPAVRGKRVCRMHGAFAGAPRGPAHGRYKHGKFTCEAIQNRREAAALIAEVRQLLATMN